jgi:hypothetical protein
MKARTIKIAEIFNSFEAKEYRDASIEIKQFYRSGVCETLEATKRYKKALERYRNFLDDRNIRLPCPKYPILKSNKNTLKYLDCVVQEIDFKSEFIKMVPNPEWLYKKSERYINVVL